MVINTGSIVNAAKSAFNAAKNKISNILKSPASVANSGPLFDSGNYFTQNYNDLTHIVDLYLDNSGDFEKPKRYFINPAAIVNLVINDAVNDWVVDGYMTILYAPEHTEQSKTGQTQSTPTGVDAAATANGQVLKEYQFRGDGFDLLRVMIMPETKPGKSGGDVVIDKNFTKWMLSYVFSVYDVEDVQLPSNYGYINSYMKCLKLKFYDIRHHMLKTTNLEYSSAIPKDSEYVPDFNTEIAKTQGVLYTGEILRDVLNEVLAKKENGGCEEFRIDKDPKKWDKGKSQLFYTSPAQYSAQDDIDYVISHHVSEKNMEGAPDGVEFQDMCLFHTERSPTFGKVEEIHLTPLQSFFEKAGKGTAGEAFKETFFVTAATEEGSTTDIPKTPTGGDGTNVNFQSFKYGQIMSYEFVDMSAIINAEMFRTAPVYSVDIGKREFNIEFKGHDIASMKKMFSKTYIKKLHSGIDGDEELFLPTIHKSKKEFNIFPTFSTNGNNAFVRQKNGLHQLLYTGLFQNACIRFSVYGSTLRESGTFIGIEKTTGSVDTDYSNKLFGQWFVVSVDHIFESGTYRNVIHAVKLHRFKPRKSLFDNLLAL